MYRNLLPILLLAVSAIPVSAQVTAGRIRYRETLKMDIQLDGDAAQFAAMLPREHSSEGELLFNTEAALYQPIAEKEDDADTDDGGPVRIRMGGAAESRSYLSLKENTLVESQEFMGRKFLITGDVEKLSWKMTGAQKSILGYPCQEAVAYKDKDTLTAWFTTGIPVAAGPHARTGLPGMILELTRNSTLHIEAMSVDPGDVPAGALVKPKSGKKVTREEFNTIRDEKLKEMGASSGPGGNVRIIIRGN